MTSNKRSYATGSGSGFRQMGNHKSKRSGKTELMEGSQLTASSILEERSFDVESSYRNPSADARVPEF